MSLNSSDLQPERTLDVLETIERLRGSEYADRLKFAINMINTSAACEEAIVEGKRMKAIICASMAGAMLCHELPKLLGLSPEDVSAALKAQNSDLVDIKAKLKKELGL